MKELKEKLWSALSWIQVSNYERRAITALLFFVLILTGVRWLRWNVFYKSNELSAAEKEQLIRSFASEKVDTNESLPELSNFDPNKFSRDQLLEAGLNEKLVSNLINYREKVRAFETVEDLGNLYTIDSHEFNRIKPYVRINRSLGRTTTGSLHSGLGQKKYYEKERAVRTIPVLELNSCLAEELEFLPGIGPVLSDRIIKYRELLGGYYALNQLLEVYGLSDTVLLEIAVYLQVDSNRIRKISIRSANMEELRSHPYISYNQAKVILAYRDQHGLKNASDLRAITVLDNRFLTALRPYIQFH